MSAAQTCVDHSCFTLTLTFHSGLGSSEGVVFEHGNIRSPYKISEVDGKTFGGLMIELDDKANTVSYWPTVSPEEKIESAKFGKKAFTDITNLLTKRMQTKVVYDDEALDLFGDIISKAKFRPANSSRKYKLVKKHMKSKSGGALVGDGVGAR